MLQHKLVKLLIDTDASRSFLNLDIVESYFPDYLYPNSIIIRSIHNSEQANFAAEIPAFLEFHTTQNISFVSHIFHDFFEGLIGLCDLQKLNLSINLKDNVLENENVKIPILHFNRNDYNPNQINTKIEPHTGKLIKLPVDKTNYDVFIPTTELNKLVIIPPQIITATGTFRNNTDGIKNIRTDIIIKTDSFMIPDIEEINKQESRFQPVD